MYRIGEQDGIFVRAETGERFLNDGRDPVVARHVRFQFHGPASPHEFQDVVGAVEGQQEPGGLLGMVQQDVDGFEESEAHLLLDRVDHDQIVDGRQDLNHEILNVGRLGIVRGNQSEKKQKLVFLNFFFNL